MSNEKMLYNSIRAVKNTFLKTSVARKLNRFRSDEDGAVVALTLFLLILFLAMAGVGIDMMRHEMRRTHLAAVADAASLAGAAAATEAQAEAIVEDYFAKNGMSEYLQEFGEDDVEISLNSARVTVNANLSVDTYLMKLSGVETLHASATATAEKRIPKLEIALVLDVSGSMSGDKLTNLKTAAKQFVTTILNGSDPGDAVISVIPFSFGVTPSDGIFEAMEVEQTHNYSTCVVFQDDDFNDTTIDPDTDYPQQIYTSRYDISSNFDTLNSSWRSCYTEDYFRVLPYSMSESALHTKIDSLQADGNTSGNEGIKWAAGLLDPAFRDVTTALITRGDVDSSLASVPADFDEPDTQKVIVMMGDGANTSSYFFNDPNELMDLDVVPSHAQADFRGPGSDLYVIERSTQVLDYAFYIYNHNAKYYGPSYEYLCAYWYYDCVYRDEDVSTFYLHDHYGDNRYRDIDDGSWLNAADFNAIRFGPDAIGSTDDDQLDWETAWGLMSPDYHKHITGSSSAYNDYAYGEKVNGSDKNDRMSDACSAIKGESVVVYTIGFEVPADGTAETHLKNCASSATRYYRASGVNINDAFNSIASNVQNLRLTQ